MTGSNIVSSAPAGDWSRSGVTIMAGDQHGPRNWHVTPNAEVPREKQKSSGRIAAEEAAARKKIEALRALRLAQAPDTPAASPAKPPKSSG